VVQAKPTTSWGPERKLGRVKSADCAVTMVATFKSADLHFFSMPASDPSPEGILKGHRLIAFDGEASPFRL